ncbi:MAG: DUF4062 domain-containing protein [Treponema sp.]|jgi:hypothetical protein|nr:DUF4062 domain-containing protein [Treponema sp.]
MVKKFHIFVGSATDDLKNERRELSRIIMELGHIPVTAEYFDPAGKDAGRFLKKTIEECDYFVALIAYKYAVPGREGSPLEAEYATALKKGIPVLSLVIDEKARWKVSRKEKDPALAKKCEEFKKKLRAGTFGAWTNVTDLCQKAQSLLIGELNLNPQTGWVRADRIVEPVLANELSRLSAENETLRRQIKIESGEIVSRLREQFKHAIKVLALNKVMLNFYYSSGDNWENSRQFRYLRVFKLLVPELAVGKTTAEISRFLGTVLNPDLDKNVRKDYPTPSNTIKKIMADFALLKLVKCSGSASGGNLEDEVWEITEYGKELYSAYRMRQLEKVFKKSE